MARPPDGLCGGLDDPGRCLRCGCWALQYVLLLWFLRRLPVVVLEIQASIVTNMPYLSNVPNQGFAVAQGLVPSESCVWKHRLWFYRDSEVAMPEVIEGRSIATQPPRQGVFWAVRRRLASSCLELGARSWRVWEQAMVCRGIHHGWVLCAHPAQSLLLKAMSA